MFEKRRRFKGTASASVWRATGPRVTGLTFPRLAQEGPAASLLTAPRHRPDPAPTRAPHPAEGTKSAGASTPHP